MCGDTLLVTGRWVPGLNLTARHPEQVRANSVDNRQTGDERETNLLSADVGLAWFVGSAFSDSTRLWFLGNDPYLSLAPFREMNF